MANKIILSGYPDQLAIAITQMIGIHQMLRDLDIPGGSNRSETHPNRRFKPLIRLHFIQDTDYVKGSNAPGYHGQRRVSGHITWRLMGETSETISKGELKRIGEQIKALFGANGGYVWSKGKEIYTYADWDNGYQMQILARSASQAQDMVTKILSIQGHVPTWKFMTKTENLDEASRYPETPQTKVILGETVTLPKIRPKVDVRFTHADAVVHKLTNPIILYDRKHKKVGALVQ